MRGSEGIWRWIVVRRRRIVWRAAFVGAGALLLGTAVLLRRRSFWATDGVLEKATEGGLVLVAVCLIRIRRLGHAGRRVCRHGHEIVAKSNSNFLACFVLTKLVHRAAEKGGYR